jgi:hypothetical protein
MAACASCQLSVEVLNAESSSASDRPLSSDQPNLGGIVFVTSTDDDLRLRHAYRVHELIESSCVRKGQTNASMRYCCAKARMVRAMCPRCVKKIAWGIPALSHSREYPVTRTRSWGPVRRCLEFVTRSWVCQCLEFETRSRSGRSQEKRASLLEQQRLASGNVSSDQ